MSNAVDHEVFTAGVAVTVEAFGTGARDEVSAMRGEAIDHVHGVVLVLAATGEIAVGSAWLDKL